MNNFWNKIIYKIWSPFYDKIFNSGVFLKARKEIFKELTFNEDQHILFVGVGTGADLELIDCSSVHITAIDFSPDMLEKSKEKFKGTTIQFFEMDAQNMSFNDNSFDYVIGSLVLSVVPNPNICLHEMGRVVKNDGKIIVFDKFAPKNNKLSRTKKILRPIIKILGTDIGVEFEELYKDNSINLKLEEDKPIMLNGMYRKIVISKQV